MTTLMADPMLAEAWTLSGSVALRPEPFGALAYHFGNRKLTFLKKQQLVDAVNALGDSKTVADALTRAGIPEAQWPAYVKALRGLATSDMILERKPS
ncbi:mycofactocin biosynthesis chaperone MftB [Aeromicrobium ginsengisoli]|nr:mycofactocin biosynthesis chaperone MftB [Aeromicrobium ginsengisoli]